MGASKGRAMPLTVARFSVQAARSVRRLSMDVVEFFAPISELFRSIASQLSYGFISLEGGRRVGALALTRARLKRPLSRIGAGRTDGSEAYEPRMLDVPNVALLLHLNLGAKLPSGSQRAAAKRRSPVQAGTAAQAALAYAPQEGQISAPAGTAAAGEAAVEVTQIGRQRGAHLEVPAISALAGAMLPALALSRIAGPIIGFSHAGFPQATKGMQTAQAESAGAEARGGLKPAEAGDAVGAEGEYRAAMAGAMLALQLSSSLAAKVQEGVYDSGYLGSKRAARQLGAREAEGYATRVARLSAVKDAESSASRSSEVKTWAALAPLITALERANSALRRQGNAQPTTTLHASALRGGLFSGKSPEVDAPDRSPALSDALLAVVALQSKLSASMPSFAAVRSAKGKRRQTAAVAALGGAVLAASAEPEVARTMAMEIMEPTFGDRLNGASRLGVGGQQPLRRAAIEDSTGEERALRALDRMRRPEGRVEPALGGLAQQPSISIDVSADQDVDLRELERRIERILQEQVRRFYGMR